MDAPSDVGDSLALKCCAGISDAIESIRRLVPSLTVGVLIDPRSVRKSIRTPTVREGTRRRKLIVPQPLSAAALAVAVGLFPDSNSIAIARHKLVARLLPS